MQNVKAWGVVIFSVLSSGFSLAQDVETLSQLTGLDQDSVVVWTDKLRAMTEVNERGASYYGVFPGLINQYNLKVGCEVGVSTGGHSYTILKNTSVKKLYSIDPYSHIIEPYFNAQVFDLFFLITKARLGEFGDRSQMVRECSPQAADVFKDEELDFVFIDANHTYESVKNDIAAWYKKVRSGGIIGGDDYATIWPGVPQAVNEFFEACGLPINIDKQNPRVWWVQKP